MPLSPPLVLEAGSGTKFQLFLLFNIIGPFLGLTRNLGARHVQPKLPSLSKMKEIVFSHVEASSQIFDKKFRE
jgi:hypothetical protein